MVAWLALFASTMESHTAWNGITKMMIRYLMTTGLRRRARAPYVYLIANTAKTHQPVATNKSQIYAVKMERARFNVCIRSSSFALLLLIYDVVDAFRYSLAHVWPTNGCCVLCTRSILRRHLYHNHHHHRSVSCVVVCLNVEISGANTI